MVFLIWAVCVCVCVCGGELLVGEKRGVIRIECGRLGGSRAVIVLGGRWGRESDRVWQVGREPDGNCARWQVGQVIGIECGRLGGSRAVIVLGGR